MKQLPYIFLSIFLFACTNKEKENVISDINTDTDTTTQSKLILTGDSGFVTMKEGMAFLVTNSLTDTTPNANAWHLFNQTDTIGKYYKIENSDHYIMCLIDYGLYGIETHIVTEIDAKGKLLKSERFFHGNYPCYWYNTYDCFSKYGDFFCIKAYGSWFSSCALYLFKEVTPQDSITPIPFDYWGGEEDNFSSLHVLSMEIKKDELIVHYILENVEKKYDEKKEDFITTAQHRSKFKIKYFYENGQWETTNKKLKECF